ncbi:MAG: hypothetical protein E5X63_45850, partial [Mesorhizobium sp.]
CRTGRHAKAIPVLLVPEDNSPHGIELKITLIAAAPQVALDGAASDIPEPLQISGMLSLKITCSLGWCNS